MFAYSDKAAGSIDVNYRTVYGAMINALTPAATATEEKLHRTWEHRGGVSSVHPEADRSTAIRYLCVVITSNT